MKVPKRGLRCVMPNSTNSSPPRSLGLRPDVVDNEASEVNPFAYLPQIIVAPQRAPPLGGQHATGVRKGCRKGWHFLRGEGDSNQHRHLSDRGRPLRRNEADLTGMSQQLGIAHHLHPPPARPDPRLERMLTASRQSMRRLQLQTGRSEDSIWAPSGTTPSGSLVPLVVDQSHQRRQVRSISHCEACGRRVHRTAAWEDGSKAGVPEPRPRKSEDDMTRRILIFDFDGTLADTMPELVDSAGGHPSPVGW